MERMRRAFTLVEVLVSVALLALVLLGLYRSLDAQRRSNKGLQEHLQKVLKEDRGMVALYRDILGGDGNLSIVKGEYDRLCIPSSSHALYLPPPVKICWIVGKEHKGLYRIEGNGYRLPLGSESKVAIDEVARGVELFDLYRRKSDLLVVMKKSGSKPYAFLIQGLVPPPKPKPKPKPKAKPKPKKSPPKSEHNRSAPNPSAPSPPLPAGP